MQPKTKMNSLVNTARAFASATRASNSDLFILSSSLLHWGFPDSSTGKESACNAEDLGLIPGLGRSPEEGKGHPLQYSGLEDSTDCTVHGVTKSWTGLSAFHFALHLNAESWCCNTP